MEKVPLTELKKGLKYIIHCKTTSEIEDRIGYFDRVESGSRVNSPKTAWFFINKSNRDAYIPARVNIYDFYYKSDADPANTDPVPPSPNPDPVNPSPKNRRTRKSRKSRKSRRNR